ncbi:MAG: O-antigen ligase family protein [Opitutales bacterium]|nr:O-antigen ligase family protein [Opitutales bacterium]
MSESVSTVPPPFARRRTPGGHWSRTSWPERILAFGLAVQLNIVLFAGGGVLFWSEWWNLGLGAALFAFAVLAYPGGTPRAARPLRRLLTFPLFWIGLLLYVYVAVQAHNVAWAYVRFEGGSGMRPVEGAVPWLPQGFVAPLEQENPFRWMLRFTPVWLAACAVWCGLRGRSAALVTLTLLALSLVVWTGIAYWQYITGAEKMLWLWEVRLREPRYFWGTFVNSNHGALTLVLGQALLLALFLRGVRSQYMRTLRLMGPHFLYLPLAFVFAAGVVPSGSRGGMVVTLVLWTVFVLLGTVALWQLVRGRALILPVAAGALLLTALGFVLNNPDVWDRMQHALTKTERLAADIDAEARTWVNRIGVEMVRDKPAFGWGAGGWRYFYPQYGPYFPEFQPTRRVLLRDRETGEIIRNERGRAQWRTVPMWYRQLHNDWLELVVELGWAGASIVFAGLLWWLGALARRCAREPAALMLATGPVLLLVAAAWEFHFRLPAPLLWTGILMVLALQLSARRPAGLPAGSDAA